MKKTGTAAGLLLGAITAIAHPGHAPGDLVAELSSPLAGPDHALAFLAASAAAVLLVRFLVRHKRARRDMLQSRLLRK